MIMNNILRQKSLLNIGKLVLVFIASTYSAIIYADKFAATEQISEKLGYKVSVVSKDAPIEINELHQWELMLEDSKGEPVDDAEIKVSGGMAAHGHGLPTEPLASGEEQPGMYLVEGMKFQMGGVWTVNFEITAEEGTDTVTFELKL